MADDEAPRLATTDGKGARLGRYRVEPLGADEDGRLRVRLARDDGAALELMVHPAGSEPRALASTPAGDVTYVARHGLDDAEAVRVGRAFARSLARAPGGVIARFPHVAPVPARLPGELGASPTREVPFDPPGLAALLAPALEVGGPPLVGFTLRSIELPRTTDAAPGTYLCALATPDGELVHVEVGPALGRPFARVGPIEIALRRFGRGSSQETLLSLEVASLLSHLAAHLGRALEGVTLRFPRSLAELRALAVPAEGEASVPTSVESGAGVLARPVLNLAVDADCGQACAFCSVKEYQPPSDGGAEERARLERELALARRAGAREVRLNGIDPLAFSEVLPLVASMRAQGFERLTVLSTGRRFADAAFARRLVAAAPAALTVVVPLYGLDAQTHDRVTGRPGAFDEVRRAIDVLQDVLTPPGALVLSTVVVRDNVDELPRLLAHADALGVPMHVHLPYPMTQSPHDRWRDAALAEADVLARVLAVSASERVRRELAHLVAHPCLLLREEQARGLPLLSLREVGAPRHLHGTEYRSLAFVHVGSDPTGEPAFAAATVPCPHLTACALAPACAGEQYALYVDRYGWAELAPISPQALYALAPPRGA
ncbi:MAG: radical SAM protein [Sandaracinaceae bacterium]|nr:radical SAM protein [Sandaracinaceae bacterium]